MVLLMNVQAVWVPYKILFGSEPSENSEFA